MLACLQRNCCKFRFSQQFLCRPWNVKNQCHERKFSFSWLLMITKLPPLFHMRGKKIFSFSRTPCLEMEMSDFLWSVQICLQLFSPFNRSPLKIIYLFLFLFPKILSASLEKKFWSGENFIIFFRKMSQFFRTSRKKRFVKLVQKCHLFPETESPLLFLLGHIFDVLL